MTPKPFMAGNNTYSLNELLAILANDTSWKLDATEADVLVHLLHVLSIEGAPATAHLKQKHAKTPKVYRLGVSLIIK